MGNLLARRCRVLTRVTNAPPFRPYRRGGMAEAMTRTFEKVILLLQVAAVGSRPLRLLSLLLTPREAESLKG